MITAFAMHTPVNAQQAGTGANYETRLSGLEDDLRNMNGRLEQLEFAIRRMEQGQQRMQADIDARLNKLELSPAAAPAAAPTTPSTPQQVKPPANAAATPAAAPRPTTEAEANPNGTLGSLKVQDGKVTGGAVNPQAPALPDTPADYGLTPQEQYDRAFGLLRQASYDDAEKAFKTFIDKNPKDKLIDNAKYWYGETLYVRARFNESTVAFADAYQQNPKGTKAPDSLLKLAMSLEAMNKTSDACTTLAELKVKYPNASASIKSRAEEERGKLDCAH